MVIWITTLIVQEYCSICTGLLQHKLNPTTYDYMDYNPNCKSISWSPQHIVVYITTLIVQEYCSIGFSYSISWTLTTYGCMYYNPNCTKVMLYRGFILYSILQFLSFILFFYVHITKNLCVTRTLFFFLAYLSMNWFG